MRTRQKQRIIIGTLCAVIIGLAVGYAVLSQQLNINGTGGIASDFNILFTDIQEGTMNGATTVNKQITDSTTATFTIDLEKPSSNGEYLITVENRGNIDAYVESIKGLEESNQTEPTDITFSIEDIKVNDKLKAKESKVFKVKVNWSSSSTNIPDTNKDLTLTINFAQDTGSTTPSDDTITSMVDNLLESSTNGTYNYMDGTYLKGSQNSNYAWFDGFLWRIMGTNADGSIRMITQDTISSAYWGASGEMLDYDNSYINDWLNNYFYPKLEHKDLLVNQIWCSEPTTDSNSARTSCTNNLSKISNPIGLLSLDEFNLSGSYSSISSMETPNMDALSYLINSNQFATLTTSDNDKIWGLFVNIGLLVGSIQYNDYYGFVGIRPIINLKSDTKIYTGDGSFNNPFQFEENNEKTGTLTDNGNIGKYVMYAGRKYRIVETSSAGTKLFLVGYYDYSGDGLIDDSDSISELDLFNIISQDSIVNWISNNNETDKNKLISTTWYKGDDIIPGDNYKTILESTSNPYEGKVGLIRVGEIMAAQPGVSYDMIGTVSDDIADLMSQKSYWTSNRDSNSHQMQVYCDSGYTNGSSDCGPHVIRPVIMISPDVQILGGNGSFNSPYQI